MPIGRRCFIGPFHRTTAAQYLAEYLAEQGLPLTHAANVRMCGLSTITVETLFGAVRRLCPQTTYERGACKSWLGKQDVHFKLDHTPN